MKTVLQMRTAYEVAVRSHPQEQRQGALHQVTGRGGSVHQVRVPLSSGGPLHPYQSYCRHPHHNLSQQGDKLLIEIQIEHLNLNACCMLSESY